ncbi:MAG TPA: hypothetical protein VN408_22165 [Actinoplanes sp.]|nr:hypothetical protein [Actinoplanes sp.]
MGEKAERHAARAAVAAYHEAELAKLVAHVGGAVDAHRAGELDAFEVDEVLFRYSRAAKELWKFCHQTQAEIVAWILREQPPADWWERAAPRRR